MEQRSELFRISSVIFRCQKYAKKGYMEMTKQIYLETLKSVLGRSILHYLHLRENFSKLSSFRLSKNMTTLLPSIFHQCSAAFNILTVVGCTKTGLFRQLGNHVFRSL